MSLSHLYIGQIEKWKLGKICFASKEDLGLSSLTFWLLGGRQAAERAENWQDKWRKSIVDWIWICADVSEWVKEWEIFFLNHPLLSFSDRVLQLSSPHHLIFLEIELDIRRARPPSPSSLFSSSSSSTSSSSYHHVHVVIINEVDKAIRMTWNWMKMLRCSLFAFVFTDICTCHFFHLYISCTIPNQINADSEDLMI